MDNITHSLIGALIGQTGLKKLSGLGMPTLIIAANIPDIDAACFLWLDGTEHLGFRRGITHGPLAMLILPLLLTAAMVGFDRWQTRCGKRPATRAPVRFGPLYLLALIGTLSHPAFDWLNNYGVRLLEPFSSRWFYGDSIFIIDVWMWAILFGGLIWSRRAEKRGGDWGRRGKIVATVLAAYVFVNGVITGIAEESASRELERRWGHEPPLPDTLVVANPVPFEFWRRDIAWRSGVRQSGSHGSYNLFSGVRLNLTYYSLDMIESRIDTTYDTDSRIVAAARDDPQVRAFLFWSRMPFAIREADGSITIKDQRYMNPLTGNRFSVYIAPEPQPR